MVSEIEIVCRVRTGNRSGGQRTSPHVAEKWELESDGTEKKSQRYLSAHEWPPDFHFLIHGHSVDLFLK